MKVTHFEEFDTHTVMGGGEVEEFSTADTAEFFTIMSKTIYTQERLAVVREVLCNAWDAHVISGRTDLPVQVLLDDNRLVIRDFGPGIAPQDMKPIYCTYGNSTKTHDGKQTGGFGLGSKAPFAYTDHFTVTSMHAGLKSVYTASRGSSEAQGKPGLTPMVRVPTEETGLEVSIPLEQAGHMQDFATLVKIVVFRGGIKATLNGGLLDAPDYSQARHRYIFVNDPDNRLPEAVSVLYGSVAYPIQHSSDYALLLQTAKTALPHIRSSSNNFRLVLIADPHSLTIPPSRETLSLNQRTRDSLRDLLQEFIRDFRAAAEPAFLGAYQSAVRKAADSGLQPELLDTPLKDLVKAPSHSMARLAPAEVYTDTQQFIRALLQSGMQAFHSEWIPQKTDLHREQLRMLARHCPEYASLAQKLSRLRKPGHSYRTYLIQIRKFVYRDMLKRLSGTLGKDRIQYLRWTTLSNYSKKFQTALCRYHPDSLHPYLAVVGHNQAGISECLSEYASHRSKTARKLFDSAAVFSLPRKKGLAAGVIADLRKAGFRVLDATGHVTAKPEKTGIKRPKGYLSLASAISETGTYLPGRFSDPDSKRVLEPVVCVLQRTVSHQEILDGVLRSHSFAKLFCTHGPETAVVTSSSTASRLKKVFGAVSPEDWILDQVEAALPGNDKLAFACLAAMSQLPGDLDELYPLLKHLPSVEAALGFSGTTTPFQEFLAKGFKHIWRKSAHIQYGRFFQIRKKAEKILENSKNLEKLGKVQLGNIFNFPRLKFLSRDNNYDFSEIDALISLCL